MTLPAGFGAGPVASAKTVMDPPQSASPTSIAPNAASSYAHGKGRTRTTRGGDVRSTE